MPPREEAIRRLKAPLGYRGFESLPASSDSALFSEQQFPERCRGGRGQQARGGMSQCSARTRIGSALNQNTRVSGSAPRSMNARVIPGCEPWVAAMHKVRPIRRIGQEQVDTSIIDPTAPVRAVRKVKRSDEPNLTRFDFGL
ncbi:MAG TPA: hypothetical protein DIC34_17715 [Treponema sp.]|nr:MAG: hypothetical protein A2Y36_16020 [Treponema sp. GWA1_62_8]OHE72555.1 MAG: hypothetical protein A2413_14650 [Treponema sp. RIFOXYC1_FULL_61_9]HCM28338.1 hypothetical protein [Treponema sp.]